MNHLLFLLPLLVLSVLTLFAVMEHAKLKQIDFGATIHASFTEVSLFRSIVLDESNSDVPSIRLSMTNVAANGSAVFDAREWPAGASSPRRRGSSRPLTEERMSMDDVV